MSYMELCRDLLSSGHGCDGQLSRLLIHVLTATYILNIRETANLLGSLPVSSPTPPLMALPA